MLHSLSKKLFLGTCLLKTAPSLACGVILAIYGGTGDGVPRKSDEVATKTKNLVRRCAARHTHRTGVFRQAEGA